MLFPGRKGRKQVNVFRDFVGRSISLHVAKGYFELPLDYWIGKHMVLLSSN
jgi:hypothetical protein